MMNHQSVSSAHSAPAPIERMAASGRAFFGALIVEGDLVLADRMRRLLCDLAPGRRVVVASTHAEAIHLLAALPYDLVLVDTNKPWTTSKENIIAQCGWSRLEGTTLKSQVSHTFVSGHLAYAEGKFDESKKGERLLFNRNFS